MSAVHAERLMEQLTKTLRKWGDPWLEVAMDRKKLELDVSAEGWPIAKYTIGPLREKRVPGVPTHKGEQLVIRCGRKEVDTCSLVPVERELDIITDCVSAHLCLQMSRRMLEQMGDVTDVTVGERFATGKVGDAVVTLSCNATTGAGKKGPLCFELGMSLGAVPTTPQIVQSAGIKGQASLETRRMLEELKAQKLKAVDDAANLRLLGEHLTEKLPGLTVREAEPEQAISMGNREPTLLLMYGNEYIGSVQSPGRDKPFILGLWHVKPSLGLEALGLLSQAYPILRDMTPERLRSQKAGQLVSEPPTEPMTSELELE